MPAWDDFFAFKLHQYLLASGKRIFPDDVSRVLSKPLVDLSQEEREIYGTYILPSTGFIKDQIRELMGQPGFDEEEWRLQLQNHSQSIIGQLVAEVFVASGISTRAARTETPPPPPPPPPPVEKDRVRPVPILAPPVPRPYPQAQVQERQRAPINKTYLAIVLIVLVILFVGIVASISLQDRRLASTSPPEEPQNKYRVDKHDPSQQLTYRTYEYAPQNFSAIGDSTIPNIKLFSGLAIFDVTHEGGGTCSIQLSSSSGEYVDLLVNTTGAFDGSKVVRIPRDGSYSLDATASGSWSVQVSQPSPTKPGSPPLSFSEEARSATPFFALASGTATFKMEHDGSANFVVTLYDSNGNYIELLANDIGAYTGTQVVPVTAGTYILDVEANGKWRIDISQ